MTTPADLLAIAQSINTAIPGETGRRTCINRAYYAIFHTASEIDIRLHLPFPTSGLLGAGHEKLYNRLIGCNPSNSPDWATIKSIGYAAKSSEALSRISRLQAIRSGFTRRCG